MNESDDPTRGVSTVDCALSDRDRSERGATLRRELFGAADQRDELSDGYAWRFPGDAAWLPRLVDFITSERTCCTFFRFEIEVEPGLGPIWLRLRGPAGTKAFLRDLFAADDA